MGIINTIKALENVGIRFREEDYGIYKLYNHDKVLGQAFVDTNSILIRFLPGIKFPESTENYSNEVRSYEEEYDYNRRIKTEQPSDYPEDLTVHIDYVAELLSGDFKVTSKQDEFKKSYSVIDEKNNTRVMVLQSYINGEARVLVDFEIKKRGFLLYSMQKAFSCNNKEDFNDAMQEAYEAYESYLSVKKSLE
jgi:hypothetical protein